MRGKILITRPQASAQKTAKAIKAMGFESVIAPVIEIKPVDFDLPDFEGIAGFIFTSVNGVQAFCARSSYRDKPVYCVGDKTAQAARDFGFHDIHNAKGTAQELATLIQEKGVYVHFRGRDVARSIRDLLIDRRDIRIIEKIVYEAQILDVIPPNILKELENKAITYALFYSPRTVQGFVDWVAKAGCTSLIKPIKALCLADSMVESLRELPWKDIILSDAPHESALLSRLKSDVNKQE